MFVLLVQVALAFALRAHLADAPLADRSRLAFFVDVSRITLSASSIAAMTWARTSLGLLMLTGLPATTAWAFAMRPLIPSRLIVKPCQRTAATMHVKVESFVARLRATEVFVQRPRIDDVVGGVVAGRLGGFAQWSMNCRITPGRRTS